MFLHRGERGASGRFRWDRQALQTNLLANTALLLSAGGTFLFALATVLRHSATRQPAMARCDCIIVPGHGLEAGRPSADFRARLDRALDLARRYPAARIVLLGGVTPGQPHSEAAAGRGHLLARGIADGRILCEETSRHTLENFQNALPLLSGYPGDARALVTNRYHLARCLVMARNLGIEVAPCPAERGRRPGPERWRRFLWEAYLLHWYHAGRLYARWTGNQGMLGRVYRRSDSG